MELTCRAAAWDSAAVKVCLLEVRVRRTCVRGGQGRVQEQQGTQPAGVMEASS